MLARNPRERMKAAIDVNKRNIPITVRMSRESKDLFNGTIIFFYNNSHESVRWQLSLIMYLNFSKRAIQIQNWRKLNVKTKARNV